MRQSKFIRRNRSPRLKKAELLVPLGVAVHTIERLDTAIYSAEPRRYLIDQIEVDPLPSGHTSRRWGTAIKRPDGSDGA
jgi:hypothetical protein